MQQIHIQLHQRNTFYNYNYISIKILIFSDAFPVNVHKYQMRPEHQAGRQWPGRQAVEILSAGQSQR